MAASLILLPPSLYTSLPISHSLTSTTSHFLSYRLSLPPSVYSFSVILTLSWTPSLIFSFTLISPLAHFSSPASSLTVPKLVCLIWGFEFASSFCLLSCPKCIFISRTEADLMSVSGFRTQTIQNNQFTHNNESTLVCSCVRWSWKLWKLSRRCVWLMHLDLSVQQSNVLCRNPDKRPAPILWIEYGPYKTELVIMLLLLTLATPPKKT